MSALRPARCVLAGALLAALGASACVDEVVVGTQRSPISAVDGRDDASWPERDAAEPDAQPPPEPDAAQPPMQDAGDSPPSDAAADDGPIVVLLQPEAGPDVPEAGVLGPCFVCDGTVSIIMVDERIDEVCSGGLDPVCWENADGTCSAQCPPAETCGASADCAADEYCYFPRSDCGVASRGWCAPRPQGDCTGIGGEVCGCDGNIYENGCHALRAGVPIAGPGYDGSCPLVLGF